MTYPGTPERTRQEIDIEQRRQHVAYLLMHHLTYKEMAAEIGCSTGTIAGDVKAVREMWAERSIEDYDAWVAEEVAKLDQLERKVLPVALTGGKPGPDGEPRPSLFATDRVLTIMERRAKLKGLDRPMRHEVTKTVEYERNLDTEIEKLFTEADRGNGD